MTTIRAGRLRQSVTIQQRPEQTDDYNQPSGDWQDVITVRADVVDLTGKELVATQKVVAEATVKITMRGYPGWRDQIKPSCRALLGARIFDIKMPLNSDGRDRELTLICVEII